MTVIPQDPLLFHSTLRSNLDPSNKHSDEDIWRALDKAQMKETVVGMADGLEHMVEEGR